jgi:hypothetical protein
MTQLDAVSRPIRLKISGQTFYGTRSMSQKTYVTTGELMVRATYR